MTTINEMLAREILDRLIRLETVVLENNRRLEERIEANNQRIEDTNRRIDESNREMGRLSERQDKLSGRIDKLFYTMLGVAAAVIATLVTGQILD